MHSFYTNFASGSLTVMALLVLLVIAGIAKLYDYMVGSAKSRDYFAAIPPEKRAYLQKGQDVEIVTIGGHYPTKDETRQGYMIEAGKREVECRYDKFRLVGQSVRSRDVMSRIYQFKPGKVYQLDGVYIKKQNAADLVLTEVGSVAAKQTPSKQDSGMIGRW